VPHGGESFVRPANDALRGTSGENGPIFRLISQSGQVHALASEMLLGRALTDDILITGEGVSAQHARITVRGAHVYLEDLDTPGGTRVNDEKIRPGDARALKPGDTIAIGASTFTLEQGT
jgi:pSer/pThr/pTyr-binding forkhead associated (FHA) protein